MDTDYDAAIIIGVGHYEHLPQKDLQWAANSAEEFASCVANLGVKSERTLKLITEQGKSIAKNSIEEAIEAFLTKVQGQGQGRRLYFYYAGHGSAPIDSDNTQAVLLASDARQDRPYRAINRKNYEECFLFASSFPEQILFIEACRNLDQGLRGDTPDWCPGRGRIEVNQFRFYAASHLQQALPTSLGVGRFTTLVIEGINGGAVRNGKVTMTTLGAFVASEMTALFAGESEQSQNPELAQYRFGSDIVITDGVEPKRTIRLNSGSWLGLIEVRDAWGNPATQAPMNATGPITLDLSPGAYSVRRLPDGHPVAITVVYSTRDLQEFAV